MNFRVTIDIFSGRPNPVLEIKGREAKQLYDRLRPAGRLSGREAAPMPPPPLGYRGLIIEPSGAKGLPKMFRLAGGDLLGPSLSAEGNRSFSGNEGTVETPPSALASSRALPLRSIIRAELVERCGSETVQQQLLQLCHELPI